MDFSQFTPELFTRIKEGIPRAQIVKDIIAGVIVGIVALPLAIAFGIASGVSPEKGIITAIVAGFIISFLGGSRVQIGGPTGAFIVLVYAVLEKYGLGGLMTATFMAGVMLLLFGIFRMGSLLKYIPRTLIVGFTTGIAVIIFSTQVKDFLGLRIESVPGEFLGKWISYFEHIDTINPWAVLIGGISIAIIIFIQRKKTWIPGPLLALLVTTAAVLIFRLPVETIGSRFGQLSNRFPVPALPPLSFELAGQLFRPALSIALLGALESLLSAVVADGMIGSRHKPNAELVAQGIANIVSPLFGGIPATGAIARTATNIKNGGRTPIAGIVHALVLLVIFLVAMPLVQYVPIATLAGILMVVAWNMSEFKAFKRVFKVNIHEVLVLLTTFILTVFADLTMAILAGFVLSLILFMKRMSDSVDVNPLVAERKEGEVLFTEELGEIPRGILIFEINGPLFFGSVEELLNLEKELRDDHRALILRLRYVPIVDATGLNRLAEMAKELEKKNVQLIISGANPKVRAKILNLEVLEPRFVRENIQEALETAKELAGDGPEGPEGAGKTEKEIPAP